MDNPTRKNPLRQDRPRRLRDNPHYVATRLLAVRARSTEELRSRLLQKGFAPDAVETVIRDCQDRKLLDDRAVARRMAEDVLGRKAVGPRALRVRLTQLKFPPAVIEETLAEVLPRDRERALAERALHTALDRLQGKDLSAHARAERAVRFLRQRGFSSAVVGEVSEALWAAVRGLTDEQ